MFNNYLFNKHLMRACLAAVFALGLAACSSSSDQATAPDPTPPPVDPAPTAYETALANIQAADTAEAAQAAYDAVNPNEITAQEAMSLMDALDERVAMILAATAYDRGKAAIMNAATVAEAQAAYDNVDQSAITGEQALTLAQLRDERVDAIETAARETMQRQDLMTAAGMLDTSDLSTQALVDAARMAIVGLRNALDAADDVDPADKAMYQTQLDDAVTAVGDAQGGIDLATARTNQMNALSTASTALQTALAALSGTTPTQALLDAANSALTALNTALTGGTDLTDTEKAPYQREADNAMAPIQTAQTARDKLDEEEQDAKDAAARAVVTKAATTKLTAMQTEADRAAGTTDEGLGGHANDAADTEAYALAISRDRDGTEVKVTDPALNNRADPKFEDQMAGLDDGRFMLVRTKDEDADGNVEEEVVVVGTDIRAPRTLPFARVLGQTLDARDLDPNVDADGDGDIANDFTALTVDQTSTDVIALVMSPAFPLTGDATLNFNGDTSGTLTDEADEVAGTYNNAAGTYRCNVAAGCTVTIGDDPNDDGTKRIITAMSAGWVFTPNAGVTSQVPDTSYLHYGFWLKKTTDEDDVLTYDEVETFAGATGLPASGNLAATGSEVRGTASYEGDAVGVYVHHVLSEGGGKIDSSTSGHFKADASLMATFGQVHQGDVPTDTSQPGTIAPNLLNSITGTIDNFTLSGGEMQDWSVNLAKGGITAGTGIFSGVAQGGGTSGSYSGTFHGSVAALTDGTIPQPSAAVGEFNANMSNGSVAGAFGVNQ